MSDELRNNNSRWHHKDLLQNRKGAVISYVSVFLMQSSQSLTQRIAVFSLPIGLHRVNIRDY